MKKILTILLCIAIIIGIGGCKKNKKEISFSKVADEKILEGATMIIKSGTLTKTGATILITDVNKDEVHTYGEDFRIDKKEDGEWTHLDLERKGFAIKDIGYNVDKNNELEMKIYWGWIYGTLEKGEYRLVKEATINEEDGAYLGTAVIYAEFTIK